jgi:hypothetical protein
MKVQPPYPLPEAVMGFRTASRTGRYSLGAVERHKGRHEFVYLLSKSPKIECF